PGNVDARLNQGLSLLALGRLDEADSAFQAVLAAAPDYADAEVGRARVAQRRRDPSAALASARRAQALEPGRTDIRGLVRELEPAPWRIDLDSSRSTLSAGLPEWTEQRLAVSRRVAEGWDASVAIERTERFDNIDIYTEGRLERRLSGGSAYVAFGGAVDADYRPELALRTGGAYELGGGLSAKVEASIARYGVGTVVSLQPGLAASLLADRLNLSVRWINVRDETGTHRQGYAIGGAFQASDRLRVRAGLADAPESSEGVTVDVRSRTVGFDLGISDRATVRVTATSEDRQAYDRDEIAVGIGWRF
ncbi:MAG TPA: YaiO family outer membrane beta-barrel protein, partial [Brevundimonas sp.]|nr:YaiO family outer membrane beta-barrel protein [Brevundimonas sp.]